MTPRDPGEEEFDFTHAIPNPYAAKFTEAGRRKLYELAVRAEGFIKIAPSLRKAFPDEASVNAALRQALRAKQAKTKANAKTAKRSARKKRSA